jgi:hypothetical protein
LRASRPRLLPNLIWRQSSSGTFARPCAGSSSSSARRRSSPSCSPCPRPASAAVAWAPCTEPRFQAFECGTLAVPLDRAGGRRRHDRAVRPTAAGTEQPDGVGRRRHRGGPGQPATPIAVNFATALASGLQDRDLLVFDQRGTGRSGALACRSLRRGGGGVRIVRGCADELGARRGFYRTSDSVADLEDLRREAGYERVALYGVSYGTKVALDYAAAFPARTERLLLDSVVPPEGPDALGRSSFAATRRILREQCAAGRCRSATPDPVGDVRRLSPARVACAAPTPTAAGAAGPPRPRAARCTSRTG